MSTNGNMSDANSDIAAAVAAAHARGGRSENPTMSTPQWEAISVGLRVAERALVEVRENKQCLDALEKQNDALEKQNRELKQELKHAVAELKHARAEHDRKIFSLENEIATKTSYRGIWKPDTNYRVCDEVTRGGRTWHCRMPTADKPGTSSAWQMKDKEDSERR